MIILVGVPRVCAEFRREWRRAACQQRIHFGRTLRNRYSWNTVSYLLLIMISKFNISYYITVPSGLTLIVYLLERYTSVVKISISINPFFLTGMDTNDTYLHAIYYALQVLGQNKPAFAEPAYQIPG